MFRDVGRFLGTIEDGGLEITPIKCKDCGSTDPTVGGKCSACGSENVKGGLPVWVGYLKPHSKRQDDGFVEIDNTEVIRASFFLYAYSGDAIFHCQNLVDAVGWNGNFQQFNTMDYGKVGDVQFSIETESYTDRNQDEQLAYRVQWVQTPSYEPQGIRKATAGEIKDAAQKFNRFKPAGTTKAAAKSTPKKPVKPKSAPKAPPKQESESAPSEIHFNDPDTTWDELQKFLKEKGEVIDEEVLGQTWFEVIKANAKQNNWPKEVDQYSVDQLRTLFAGVIQELRLDIPF